jgi:signal transduction histidine kinase
MAIAVADYLVGIALSLSVFYFIPVAGLTVAVSGLAGLAMAAVAAVAWTLADAQMLRSSAVIDVANAGLRFGALSFVVVLLAALRRAVQEARASEQRSKDFLAYAAHQLRSPLAGLRASAEALVLSGAWASAAQRERLASNLTAEADRMGRLVRSLLRLTRLDAGDRPRLVPTDVHLVVQTEIQRLQMVAPRLDIVLVLGSALPDDLVLDPDGLAEILANLLDNARRHATSRVDVSVRYAGGEVRIGVVDDGPGLPTGTEGRAFDRFVSLDGHGGTGLGLSIVRSIAQAHGGTAEYRDTGFMVTLPATSGTSPSDDGRRSPPGTPVRPPARSRTAQ